MPPLRSLYVTPPSDTPTMGPVTMLQRLRDMYEALLPKDFPPAQLLRDYVIPTSDVSMPMTTMLPGGRAAKAVATAVEDAAPAVKQTLKAFHGSPNMMLEDVSATPKVRQFPNAQSELGAFATLDEEEAARYADINRKGTGGRVYPVDLSLKNPKELNWSEFSRFNDITKDKAGKSLPNTQWDQRNKELIQEAKQFRADLEAKGHDGIVVRDTKGNPIEVASFKDIPLRQRALPFEKQVAEISKKYGISLPAAASLYKWQQSQSKKGVE